MNKMASAVRLRFDTNSASLPDEVRSRLRQIAKNRITEDGTLVIVARRYRTQDQNRGDAIQRLVELIRKATEAPKTRRKTRPTAASVHKRLESKRRRSKIKRMRQDLDE